MVSEQIIQQAVELLRQAANPRRIILFGSYARGQADDRSDVDLMVIEGPAPDVMSEMVRLRRVLSPLRIPVDVLVVSETDFDYWCDTPGTVMHEAAREGRVVYEAA